MEVLQHAAKMLVDFSKSQDAAAGDSTTTVVVIAGALLKQCLSLLSHGIHPTVISDSLHKASNKAVDVFTAMAVPLKLSDRKCLIKSASTSLNSKVVSQYSTLLGPLAIDSVVSVVDPEKPDFVDLRDIKIVKKLGGAVDDTEMVKD
ncbi:Chaperonin Cpn60/TCP-1 [Corchorus olitorius]|uniref:Chaperonin Cpn60/TCP-1 n=1 Tax=Corchorus olitorius TaxID=93759 RepID=A0A1R3KR67_9ROSI|nr:Chaperonin Cpn60/TCP-1 [Corchorus olitorius]